MKKLKLYCLIIYNVRAVKLRIRSINKTLTSLCGMLPGHKKMVILTIKSAMCFNCIIFVQIFSYERSHNRI